MAGPLKKSVSGMPQMAAALVEYTPRLHQYVRRLLRDPSGVADVMQETFRRFLSRAQRPELVNDPLAFLLGMARNVARELHSEERRMRMTFDSTLVQEQADSLDQSDSTDSAEELAIQDD